MKELLQDLKRELLSSFGNSETEAINEMKRYKKEFPCYPGYNIYAYGNIMPYYSQIREFFERHNVKVSDNDTLMQKFFERCIKEAVDDILKGIN